MIVKMPDGTNVSFPDDMPKEQIRDLIASKFPDAVPQQSQQPQTQLGADRRMADDAQVAAQTAEGRREAYNQLPEWQKPLQALDDNARLMGNPFGLGDKFAAGMNSMTGDLSYDDRLKIERNATQAARDRADSAALPAEIMGDVLTGGAIAKQGLTLAGRLGTANMSGIKGVLARGTLAAPEAAAYGALDALGRDTDVATGATVGAIAGPLGSVVGDTVSKVASKVLPAKTASKVPSLEKLHEEADKAYKASEKAGLIIKPDVMQRVRANVQQKLTDFGYHPQNHPAVKVALDELDRVSQGNITLKGIDTARKITRRGVNPTNPEQTAALHIVIDEIDNAVNSLGSKDIIVGDPRQGVNSLLKARELWTRVKKNERFADSIESAQLQAKSTYSGGNIENKTRQELRRFIDPKVKSRPKNWTPDEAAALKEVVNGTLGQNSLRLFGKLAPQGNGLNLFLQLAAAGGTAGMSVPFSIAGAGAKYMADRGVRQAVQHLDELIRVGGSEANLKTAQAALRGLSHSQREAVARVVQMAIIESQARSEAPAQ